MSEIQYIGKCCLVTGADRSRTLVIGDLHFGYEEVLNRAGVYVSRQMFGEMMKDMEAIFSRVGSVERVVLLGDVKHDFGTIVRQEWKELRAFFTYLEKYCREIIVVQGNHDMLLGPVVRDIPRLTLTDFYLVDGICFAHGDVAFPRMNEGDITTWILGHGHPAILLREGVKQEKYKCFFVGMYTGKKVIIVPSFFSPTEGSDPRQNDLGMAWPFAYEKFQVKVVGEDLDVLDFGKLGNLEKIT